jgi:hypothetical protein
MTNISEVWIPDSYSPNSLKSTFLSILYC